MCVTRSLPQARFAADNEYDPDEEPRTLQDVFPADLHQKFLNMVRRAFPEKISVSGVTAILKRCTIILNTKHRIYVRPASKTFAIQTHCLA